MPDLRAASIARAQRTISSEPKPPRAEGRSRERARAGWLPPLTRRHVVELSWALLSAVVALAIAVVKHKLWDAHLRVPLQAPHGDNTQALTTITTLSHHLWWWTDPQLGAPDGAQQYDFGAPFGDTMNLLIGKIALLAVNSPGFALNAIWFAGFPLAAITAHLVLRSLRLPLGLCIAGAVLFSIMPFHFFRGEGHVWISGYWGVPLGAWLVLGVLGHVEIWRPRAGAAGWRRYVSWSSARLLLVTFVIAGTLVYDAVFTVLLLVTAAGIVAFRRRTWRAALPAGVLAALILGWFALSASPSFVYNQSHGKNERVGVRSPAEADIYGLKASQMLLPPLVGGIELTRKIGRKLNRNNPLLAEGSSPYLGIVFALGFVFMVGYVLVSTGRARGPGRPALIGDVGTLALVAFVIGTVGGGSALIATLLTAQMRGWNRISIVIAFLVIVGVCAAADALLTRARASRRKPRAALAAATAAIAALAVLAAVEQTSAIQVPDYEGVAAEWYGYGALVGDLEHRLPDKAAVMQLPYTPFPEHGNVNRMSDYDNLVPYFFAKDLRFTAGEMKGRPEDWMALTSRMSQAELVAAAAAAGFSAVWLDRYGYPYGDSSVEDRVRHVAGVEPVVGVNEGRIAVYPLAGLKARIDALGQPDLARQAGDHLVHPPHLTWSGFDSVAETPLGYTRWSHGDSTIRLASPDGAPRDVELRFALISPAPAPVTIRYPGGVTRHYTSTSGGRPVVARFRTTPGDDVVRMTSGGPDFSGPNEDNPQHFQIEDLTVVDPAAVELAKRIGPAPKA